MISVATASLADNWPDGTKIDSWFFNKNKVNVDNLGKKYIVTDYGVKNDSSLVQTEALQRVIDMAAGNGRGWCIFPIQAMSPFRT